MPDQAKTTKRTGGTVRATAPVTAATTSPVATGPTTAPAVAPSTRAADVVAPVVPPATSPRPVASPRLGVRVNATTVENAFLDGTPSRSVALVQHALRGRGFDVGAVTGTVDFATRAAYAAYQRTIDERPTGLPTVASLEYLGLDVVG